MNNATSLHDLLRKHGSEFVHASYLAILGRAADPEGLRYYLNRIEAGYGKRSILAQIARSPERIHRDAFLLSISDDAAFLTAAYRALLGREPDPQGFDHHLAALRKGEDRRRIVDGMISSPEAQTRAQARATFEAQITAFLKEEAKSQHWFRRWFGRWCRLERQINRLEYAVEHIAQATGQLRHDLQQGAVLLEQGALPAAGEGDAAALSPRARLLHKRLASAHAISRNGVL